MLDQENHQEGPGDFASLLSLIQGKLRSPLSRLCSGEQGPAENHPSPCYLNETCRCPLLLNLQQGLPQALHILVLGFISVQLDTSFPLISGTKMLVSCLWSSFAPSFSPWAWPDHIPNQTQSSRVSHPPSVMLPFHPTFPPTSCSYIFLYKRKFLCLTLEQFAGF